LLFARPAGLPPARTDMTKARNRYIIGVDLGGTNIVVGAMPEDGSRELAIRSEPTHAERGSEAVVDRIASMIAQVISDVIASQGGRNVVGITIGTGIGGGIVIGGKLYHGSSDVAGEIGHTTIDSTGRYCRCGNYGCLEAYASGPAIALRAREALERDEVSALHKMVKGDLDLLTAATVYEAAHRGDALALEVVRDTARFLGTGIANLLNTVNPDVVV